MDEDLYPPAPSSVPLNFTKPGPGYKRHMLLAVAALAFFLALYFCLASWFAWTAYRLLTNLGKADFVIAPLFGGVCAAFLALFMFKSLFVFRRGKHEGFEIKRENAPALFAFLEKIADEAKAPRPHRVFLSPRVNAGVFYDLSLANLIFRSRKNLEIGLGLVNVLPLSEFKAVVAHEFGHFGQGSMAIGRWFYTAQQMASHIVVARGRLDSFLQGISNIDLRVAWIGWILRLIVWSIRSIFDSVFGWVMRAQRALSREMEFQADLVAASLTGSDALVHALHRLDAADDAMDSALSTAEQQAQKEQRVPDLFAIQSHFLRRKGEILDDAEYGKVPELPTDAASHRVFRAQLAHPPRMWASHPPNDLREENVKKHYLAAALDDRSSWILFEDPQSIREQVSASIFKDQDNLPPVISTEDVIADVEKRFKKHYLDPAYRGVYLGRSIARGVATAAEMSGSTTDIGDVRKALGELYPSSLTPILQDSRELAEEQAMLQAVERGVLDLPGKMLNYRGQEFHRRELPSLLLQVETSLNKANEQLAEHDRRARAVHRHAAELVSPEWNQYLVGLADIIHYADHREADLSDAMDTLDNVLSVVMADGRVTEDELQRLAIAAGEPHSVLAAIHLEAEHIDIGPVLREHLETESWHKLLGEYELSPPNPAIMGEWIEALPSWAESCIVGLRRLSSFALDELLAAEEQVALASSSSQSLSDAPQAPKVDTRYQSLLAGQERPKQTKLGWWDRFQTADGWVPGVARFGTAGALVGFVVWLGLSIGGTDVMIVNGLSVPVQVSIGGEEVRVSAQSTQSISIDEGTTLIRATNLDGDLIESFKVDTDSNFSRYVYNVGNATPLLTWDPSTDAKNSLGAPRWRETEAVRALTLHGPISASEDEGVILISLAGEAPQELLGEVEGKQRLAMLRSHIRWDSTKSSETGVWFSLGADELEDFSDLLGQRLATAPEDVVLLRLEQDQDTSDVVCERHRAQAEKKPKDGNWQYLAARCEANPAARSRLFESLYEQWTSNGWLAYARASGALDDGDLESALRRLKIAEKVPALRDASIDLRVRLLQAHNNSPVDLTHWQNKAPHLEYFALFRTDPSPTQDLAPIARSMQALHKGETKRALALLGSDESSWQLVIAASDGASEEAIASAFDAWDAAKAAEAPFEVSLYGLALARRTGRDESAFVQRLASDEDIAALTDFLATIDSPESAEILLEGLTLRKRAAAYAAAVIILGAECPESWRKLATQLLFIGERPYFR
tara:strand:- start:30076 stop:33840 length:3765 start_codon:yes stop_codon:yes gene_type:complete